MVLPRPRSVLVTRSLLAVTVTLLVVGFGSAASPAAAMPTAPSAALPRATWPLAGAPVVLAGFEPPTSTYGAGHRGVDLAGAADQPVLAAAAGTVTVARVVAGVPVVVVDHGALRSTYQPVAATVAVGTRVGAGDPVGRLLAGGHCGDRPCLHWGVLRGHEYLDPLGLVSTAPTELTLLPAEEQQRAAQRLRARTAAAERVSEVSANAVALALGQGSGRFGLVPPVGGPVSSPYGDRFHPVLHVWKLHDGTDFAAACGTPIRAPAAGVVTRRSADAAYGNRLVLDHGTIDGTHVVTALNHAADYTVAVGTRVRPGEVVGHVGATGLATGCHLHLMVWLDGRLVNPETAL